MIAIARLTTWHALTFGFVLALSYSLAESTAADAVAIKQGDAEAASIEAPSLGRLNQIAAGLRSKGRVSLADYEFLKHQHSRYLARNHPASSNVRLLLQSAMVRRQDWPALVDLLSAIEPAKTTEADTLNLAKAYLKMGLYQKSLQIANALDTNTSGVISLYAQSALRLGKYQQIIAKLTPLTRQMIDARNTSDLNLLALAQFEADNAAAAKSTAQQVLALDQSNIVAIQLLGRVHAQSGDFDQADQYFAAAEREQAALVAAQKKGTKLASLSIELNQALSAKDYQRVIYLVENTELKTDAKIAQVLQQYRAAAQAGLAEQP